MLNREGLGSVIKTDVGVGYRFAGHHGHTSTGNRWSPFNRSRSVRNLYAPRGFLYAAAAMIAGMEIVAVVGSPIACGGLCAPSRDVTPMLVATPKRKI